MLVRSVMLAWKRETAVCRTARRQEELDLQLAASPPPSPIEPGSTPKVPRGNTRRWYELTELSEGPNVCRELASME